VAIPVKKEHILCQEVSCPQQPLLHREVPVYMIYCAAPWTYLSTRACAAPVQVSLQELLCCTWIIFRIILHIHILGIIPLKLSISYCKPDSAYTPHKLRDHSAYSQYKLNLILLILGISYSKPDSAYTKRTFLLYLVSAKAYSAYTRQKLRDYSDYTIGVS
jgi:hypothetical protein